jgi:hypothetical protein
VLPFSFNKSNCGTPVTYRRERDWILTLEQAGFGTPLFSICAREKMIFDEAASCVHYTCDGQFPLPTRFGVAQIKHIQENVLQSIVYDTAATVLDFIGVIVEYCVLIVFLSSSVAIVVSAVPMRHVNPYMQPGSVENL